MLKGTQFYHGKAQESCNSAESPQEGKMACSVYACQRHLFFSGPEKLHRKWDTPHTRTSRLDGNATACELYGCCREKM